MTKTSKNIKIKLFFQLPAGNLKPNITLGTILGQNGIIIKNFISKFNDESLLNYTKDVIINTQVNIFYDKTFEIIYKQPKTSFLIQNLFKNSNNKQKIFNFYKIIKLKEINNNNNSSLFLKKFNLKLESRIIKGTLKSFNQV